MENLKCSAENQVDFSNVYLPSQNLYLHFLVAAMSTSQSQVTPPKAAAQSHPSVGQSTATTYTPPESLSPAGEIVFLMFCTAANININCHFVAGNVDTKGVSAFYVQAFWRSVDSLSVEPT